MSLSALAGNEYNRLLALIGSGLVLPGVVASGGDVQPSAVGDGLRRVGAIIALVLLPALSRW